MAWPATPPGRESQQMRHAFACARCGQRSPVAGDPPKKKPCAQLPSPPMQLVLRCAQVLGVPRPDTCNALEVCGRSEITGLPPRANSI